MTFKIFEAIRSQMSSKYLELHSVCALNWFEDQLELFLTTCRIRLRKAREIILGRPVCFFIPYASGSLMKFAITVPLR